MSMFKLYKFSLAMPKKNKYPTLLNKESIAFAITGVKLQVRGSCGKNVLNNSEMIRHYKVSDNLQKLINTQIEAERQAAQDYLGIALGYLDVIRPRRGAGGFFMRKYQEELDHAQDFLQYQTLRSGTPVISAIQQLKFDKNSTLIAGFTRALEIEKHLTELAEKIVLAANAEKDYECADFVDAYLDDQMKSICEIQEHLTRLLRFSCPHGCYHYDLVLAKTYPYKYKKKRYTYLYC